MGPIAHGLFFCLLTQSARNQCSPAACHLVRHTRVLILPGGSALACMQAGFRPANPRLASGPDSDL